MFYNIWKYLQNKHNQVKNVLISNRIRLKDYKISQQNVKIKKENTYENRKGEKIIITMP